MKIYTKTGDKGETSLLGGKRLPKFNIRIDAYGNIDELNAFIGLLRDHLNQPEICNTLIHIQDRLFTIGSILAAAGETEKFKLPVLTNENIVLLEKEIDAMNDVIEPMRSFILPGGHVAVSYAHVCRTICRRAERRCVELAELESVPNEIVKYLNRLSDYLFVLARYIAKLMGAIETPWQPKM